jgi:hypothetical protein
MVICFVFDKSLPKKIAGRHNKVFPEKFGEPHKIYRFGFLTYLSTHTAQLDLAPYQYWNILSVAKASKGQSLHLS